MIYLGLFLCWLGGVFFSAWLIGHFDLIEEDDDAAAVALLWPIMPFFFVVVILCSAVAAFCYAVVQVVSGARGE